MVGIFKKATLTLICLIALNVQSAENNNNNNKIAVVDLQLVLEKTDVVRDINTQVEKLETEMHQKYISTEESFNKRKEELLQKKSTMSEDAYDKKLEDINQEMLKSQNDINYRSNIINKARYNVFMKIQDKIVELISDIAKKQSINFVFPKGVVLYSDKEVTKEIIEALNRSMPTAKLDIESVEKEYEK